MPATFSAWCTRCGRTGTASFRFGASTANEEGKSLDRVRDLERRTGGWIADRRHVWCRCILRREMIQGHYKMTLSCDTENCPDAATLELTGERERECLRKAGDAGWTFSEKGHSYCPRCTKARSHEDTRPCPLRAINGRPEMVIAVCSCGRTKEYYAGDKDHFCVCNGVVILKYHNESLPSFWFFYKWNTGEYGDTLFPK